MDFIKGLKDRTVFIVGSKKNAGKTTFLNYAMSRLRGTSALGALSVGVDGESADLVFGTPKPQLKAEKGDILLSSEAALAAADLHCEILNVYPFRTAIGRPVLVRALRPGRAEISGPENNSQLAEVLADMRRHGASTIFVDGAVDRITQVAAAGRACFVYVARVEPENLDSGAAALRLLWDASAVPLCRSGEKLQEPVMIIDGALTPGRLPGKEARKGTLVLEDFTKVFLGWQQWAELRSRFELRFSCRPEPAAFVVNLFNVSRADFEKKLAAPALAGRLVYNPYKAGK